MVPKTKAKKSMKEIHPTAYLVAQNIDKMIGENGDKLDDIAALLNVSRTTLWRRLHKSPYLLSLMELDILCHHWGVGMETMFTPPLIASGKQKGVGAAG